jgi:DNA-binding XRE family transcriptional regulator
MTGKELRTFRESIGMTQADFGKAIGYSRAPIIDLELHPETVLRLRMQLAVEAFSIHMAASKRNPALVVATIKRSIEGMNRRRYEGLI